MVHIEHSRQRIERVMQWRIHEQTFKVIEEETCIWVAEVTTTHLGNKNHSFFILVQGYHHFVIEKRWRQKLREWLSTLL